MRLTIQEHDLSGDAGILVVLDASPDAGSAEWRIPGLMIQAICNELCQGRDIEDGLAPIYVLASFINTAVEKEGWTPPIKPWAFPEPPEWLDFADWYGVEDVDAMRESYDVTPVVMALASLTMLGGDKSEVTLEEQN